MGKLSEVIHWMWGEAQLASSPLMQDKVVPNLLKARDGVSLMLNPYLTVYRWRGQSETGPLAVSYAGLGDAALHLKNILFVEEPTVTEVKRVPAWRPGELYNSADSDIVVIESTKRLIENLPGDHAITLPFMVDLTLDLQGSWEDVRHRLHRTVRNYELRLVRKHGYGYKVSRDDRHFDMFYHEMYVPTLKTKHPELGSPMPVQQAYQHFRHGQLFLVQRDGRYVSGSLSSICRDVVNPKLIGVVDADDILIKEGAQGAVYYALVHWSNQEGYTYINYGSCWSHVGGVFLYKRKWGAAVSVSPRHENKRIWIKVQRDTPAVRRFLTEHPRVTIDRQGELQLLVVVDDADNVTSEAEARWHKRYATPGLKGPIVRSVGELLSN